MPRVPQIKVTPENFAYFKERCLHWHKELGLTSWVLEIRWERMTNQADCFCYPDQKEAMIRLKKGKIDKYNIENLDRLAFHEIGELLCWTLGEMAEKKYPEDRVTQERHTIINTFENAIFGSKEGV